MKKEGARWRREIKHCEKMRKLLYTCTFGLSKSGVSLLVGVVSDIRAEWSTLSCVVSNKVSL